MLLTQKEDSHRFSIEMEVSDDTDIYQAVDFMASFLKAQGYLLSSIVEGLSHVAEDIQEEIDLYKEKEED